MKRLFAVSTALLMQGVLTLGAGAQPINENQLSDPRVRQAIAYAIDMDTIVETLFEGKAIKAVGLLPNGPNKPDDLNPYTYDPDKARELLQEAGWDSNRQLDVVYYYNDQLTSDFMAAIQAYLADAGIQMNYRLIEGDIGAQIGTMPVDPVAGPSTVKWDILYGARAALALQEYFNRFAYGEMPMIPNIPEMNDLVAKINGTTDPEEQREGYFAIERLINENAYIVPLYYQQLYSFDSDPREPQRSPLWQRTVQLRLGCAGLDRRTDRGWRVGDVHERRPCAVLRGAVAESRHLGPQQVCLRHHYRG